MTDGSEEGLSFEIRVLHGQTAETPTVVLRKARGRMCNTETIREEQTNI